MTESEISLAVKRVGTIVKSFNAVDSKEIAECRKFGIPWDACRKRLVSAKPSEDGTAVMVEVETVIRENYWKGLMESYVRSSEITKRLREGIGVGTELVVRLLKDSRYGVPDEKRIRLWMDEHVLEPESKSGFFL